MARVDGEFAYQYALGLESVRRQEYAGLAFRIWVQNSPDQAWEAFLSLTNFGQDRSFKAEMLIYGVAEKDINKAIAFFNELSNETDCIDCSAHAILNRIFFNGEENEIEIYQKLVKDPFKLEQWENNKWDSWGYFQPRVALEKIELIDSETAKDLARKALYTGWARYQPNVCVEYLVSHESDEVFADIFPHIINEWGRFSLLEESLELIKSIDRDSITDRSIIAIVSRLAKHDPEYSWELVSSIEDTILRNAGIRDFVYSMSKFDPDFLRTQIDEMSDFNIQYEVLWWFLQYVPGSGHFDFSTDMRFFEMLGSQEIARTALDNLVSETLNVTTETSERVDSGELAAAIRKLNWLSDRDKLAYLRMLETRD